MFLTQPSDLSIDSPIQEVEQHINNTVDNLIHCVKQLDKVHCFKSWVSNLLITRPPSNPIVYEHLYDVTDQDIGTCIEHLEERTITFHSLRKLETFFNEAIKFHFQTRVSLERTLTIVTI